MVLNGSDDIRNDVASFVKDVGLDPILLTLVYQNVKRVSIIFQEFSQFHFQKKNLSAKTQTDFFTLRYEVLKRVSRIERQL